MQKCHFCEKPIYGHPQVKAGQQLVCGSCPLAKSQGGPSGKSFFEVRLSVAKMVTKQIPGKQENVMSDLKVKSNVRNRTILLDGKYPLVFDAKGLGKMPAHLLPALEREMVMKPGRYSLVVEEAPVPQVPTEPEVELEVEIEEEQEQTSVEEVPVEVDQSFLTEEPKLEAKKSSKKKK